MCLLQVRGEYLKNQKVQLVGESDYCCKNGRVLSQVYVGDRVNGQGDKVDGQGSYIVSQ